jgi:inward rectifier potassium channel
MSFKSRLRKNTATSDPGFGERYNRESKRIVNPDGTFNVFRRLGGRPVAESYQWLINASWTTFFLWTLVIYSLVNLLFAFGYLALGEQSLIYPTNHEPLSPFWKAVFFSSQTLTTVGYGHISPSGWTASFLSTVEALVGLMMFALVTGLLYGRFANPRAKVRFSKNALIVKTEGKPDRLMFRLVNLRPTMLIDLEARVILSYGHHTAEGFIRRYATLKLEHERVSFLPLNWTLVHDIDETSPMYGQSLVGLKDFEFELLVLIQAFDDTYSQSVHARYSYTAKEIIDNASFRKVYQIEPNGDVVMDIEDIDLFDRH